MSYPDRLIIDVTAEDIERGEQGSHHACPIALAATRVLGEPASVAVDVASMREAVCWAHTRRSMRFMGIFDGEGRDAVSPARFILRRKR